MADQIKQSLARWVELSNRCDDLEKEVHVLKQEKDVHSKIIHAYMKELDIKEINVNNDGSKNPGSDVLRFSRSLKPARKPALKDMQLRNILQKHIEGEKLKVAITELDALQVPKDELEPEQLKIKKVKGARTMSK